MTKPENKNDVALKVIRGLSAAGNAGVDRVIHERMRLAIVSALSVNPSLSFMELKSLLDASDGNLSVHARKLEDAGYITCSKTFEDRHPRTEYCLTPQGRSALSRYLAHMEALVTAMKPAPNDA